jgi:hypothetical protein
MQAVPRSVASPLLAFDAHRWALLAVQLPAHPSKARVKVWRRLQQLGAVPIKHAVYVLPYSTQAVEDFAWLRTEVEGSGGQAAVFSATAIEDLANDDIVEQFRQARTEDYQRLQKELRAQLARVKKSQGPEARAVRTFRDRFEQIRGIDFFPTPVAAEVLEMLESLETATRRTPNTPPISGSAKPLDPGSFADRIWVTRPRPGVDRFASAWFIRKFIDPQATFVFGDRASRTPGAIPFDMYDGEGFAHEGGRCTFEVLKAKFGIRDAAVNRIAELVHDADMKDERYHAPQAPTIELVVQGLRASIADDARLLESGMALFEALYRGLGPGSSAPPRKRSTAR